MATDRKARADLQNALVSYMAGKIRTYEFVDRNSQFYSRKTTTDDSVHQVARFLYSIHDDVIDHPISATEHGWAALRRIVAFLGTDLEADPTQKQPAWPFRDQGQWRANEWLVDKVDLPDYDPAIHCRQIQSWWNRIPSTVGFAVLGCILIAVLIVLVLM